MDITHTNMTHGIGRKRRGKPQRLLHGPLHQLRQLSSRTSTGERGAALDWRKRLGRSMDFPAAKHIKTFQQDICLPAMEEVCEELNKQGADAELVHGDEDIPHLALNVTLDDEQNFTYQIWARSFETPAFAHREHDRYYRLEVYLLEGSQGYDLMGYTRDQVIEDILDQYERHMNFLHMSREAPGSSATVPDSPELPE